MTTADAHRTAVVIVNYRTKELTAEAVGSVLGEPEVGEVVVVDNASGDGSAEWLPSRVGDGRLRVVESDRNRGFGPAVNLGASHARAPLLLVLNSDATLAPGSLGPLVRALLADEAVGVVAPAVYQAGGALQPDAFGRLPTRRDIVLGNGWVGDDRHAAAPGWVSGVAMLLRRSDFLALGGFDEGFEMYFEDLDLCRRLWESGKSVRREPSASVVHRGGESWQSGREKRRRYHRGKLRYYQKLGARGPELLLVRVAGAVRTALAPR